MDAGSGTALGRLVAHRWASVAVGLRPDLDAVLAGGAADASVVRPAWPPERRRSSYPLGPGEMMLRLLENRNIGPYSPRVLSLVGDGPMVSSSTMAMLGPGRTRLTPQYVTTFAAVRGIPDDDLAAVAAVPAATDRRLHRNHGELARLAWDARRLDGGQLSDVLDLASSLR